MTSLPTRTAGWIGVALLGGFGLTVAAGGGLLVYLQGSPYYLLAGLGVLVCSGLFRHKRRAALGLYAWLLAITVGWALWEVGADGWALIPRIGLPLALGAVFILPGTAPPRRLARYTFLTLGAAAAGATLHYFENPRPADPLFRAGVEALQPSGNPQAFSITEANVSNLKPAWSFHTGNLQAPLEVTPLKVGDLLYLCTGTNDVIALDAETGQQRWRYDSGAGSSNAIVKVCRGVAYFHAGSHGGAGGNPNEPGAACADRIITNTIDARLIALDSGTGKPCEGFGVHGEVSLLRGMGDSQGQIIPGYYSVTSAPTLVQGLIIVGGWVSDAQYWGEPSGVVRAFDAVTGKFVWAFDMGRQDSHEEPPPGGNYTPSTPNAWAPMSADEELGLIYVPTGNTSGSDYYGGLRRPFDERFSSSVIALNVRDGTVQWSFQTVHHDLWDYDVAARPVLTELKRSGGEVVPALIEATKTGELFVLDRRNGSPIFPVTEVPVPAQTSVPGERLSPTQPASLDLPSVGGPRLEERDMWGLTPLDQLWCRIKFRQARYAGTFTPPGVTGFIQYPGILGGVEWSSVSVDEPRSILFVNASRIANYARLIPRAQADAEGRAPEGFGGHYPQRAQWGTPYAVANPPFLSPLGIPCQNPPFGTLSAINLATGKLLWTRRLGTASSSGPWGIPSHLPIALGTPNLGGSLTTGSGLVFIAAGQDHRLRAFRSEDGQLVAQWPLPAVAVATPMTYQSARSGRQFVVVAAGNTDPRLGPTGDSIIAFALPR